MLKRIVLLALALMLWACAALGEGLIDFDTYANRLTGLSEEEWTVDGAPEIRLLRLSETLTLSVCLSEDRVAAVTVEALQDQDFADAASAALDALGCLDDEVLEALSELDDGGQAISGGCVFGRVDGERRTVVYAAAEEDFDELVWQSVHGGSKYHARMRCSGMDVPRLVTRQAAQNAEYEPCGRCFRND